MKSKVFIQAPGGMWMDNDRRRKALSCTTCVISLKELDYMLTLDIWVNSISWVKEKMAHKWKLTTKCLSFCHSNINFPSSNRHGDKLGTLEWNKWLHPHLLHSGVQELSESLPADHALNISDLALWCSCPYRWNSGPDEQEWLNWSCVVQCGCNPGNEKNS